MITMEPPALRRVLLHKTLKQLGTTFHDLGVDWDDVEGSTRETKARELISFLNRRGRANQLYEYLYEQIADLLLDRFSMSDLQTVCFDLGLDYQAFPHSTKIELIGGLMANVEWDAVLVEAKKMRFNLADFGAAPY